MVSRAWPIAKTLLFVVLVPGTVVVYVPRRILLSRGAADLLPLGAWRFAAVILVAAGAAMNLWCAWDFAMAGLGTPLPIDPPKRLVARGLYRRVRNPMYLGIVLILIGEAVLFRSRSLFLYAGAAFVFFFLFVLAYEEPVLRHKFGEDYERYCDSVPRWLPRLSKDPDG